MFPLSRCAVFSFSWLGYLFRVIDWVLYAFDPLYYYAYKWTAQWLLSDAIEDLQSVYSTLEQNWRGITVISFVSWHGFLGSSCAYSLLSTLSLNWFVQSSPKSLPNVPPYPRRPHMATMCQPSDQASLTLLQTFLMIIVK